MREEESLVWKRGLVLIAISLVLLGLDSLGWVGFVKRGVEIIFVPMTTIAADSKARIGRFFSGVRGVRVNQEKIADLERQVAQLTVDASKSERLEEEVRSLKNLVGVDVAVERKLYLARVVGRGGEWILSHFEGNTYAGAGVISEQGLYLGRVTEAGKFTSRMRLTSHPLSILEVETEKGTRGKIVGRGTRMELTEVMQEDELKKGARLLTLGDDDLPSGLVVGKVGEVLVKPEQVYKQALVEELVDENQILYVYVIGE